MKRIDKFTKEEIIKQLAYSDETMCNHCIHQTLEGRCAALSCIDGVMEWFNQEIKIVPRIKTIDTRGKYKEAYKLYLKSIHEFNNSNIVQKEVCEDGWIDFLLEEVEVEQ